MATNVKIQHSKFTMGAAAPYSRVRPESLHMMAGATSVNTQKKEAVGAKETLFVAAPPLQDVKE